MEHFILESNGVLSNGILTEILTTATHQYMTSGKKNIIIEQMMIYFLQAVQIDETLTLRPRIVRQTRHSAILDYDIYLKL